MITILTISTGYWMWARIMVYGPTIRNYSQKLEDLDHKFNDLEIVKENLPKIQETFRLSDVNFDTLKNQIPDNSSYPRLFEQIRELADKHQVEIKSFSPNMTDSYPAINTFLTFSSKYIKRYPVEVHLLGHFMNIGIFLEELMTLPYIVNIHNLKIESEFTNRGSLSCNLILFTYMFIEKAKAV